MSLVLDAGALVALERNDRPMWVRLKAALVDGTEVTSHGGVIGQVWRSGGPRQALLARSRASTSDRWTKRSVVPPALCSRGREAVT